MKNQYLIFWALIAFSFGVHATTDFSCTRMNCSGIDGTESDTGLKLEDCRLRADAYGLPGALRVSISGSVEEYVFAIRDSGMTFAKPENVTQQIQRYPSEPVSYLQTGVASTRYEITESYNFVFNRIQVRDSISGRIVSGFPMVGHLYRTADGDADGLSLDVRYQCDKI